VRGLFFRSCNSDLFRLSAKKEQCLDAGLAIMLDDKVMQIGGKKVQIRSLSCPSVWAGYQPPLNSPEAIFRAKLDIKGVHQEVLDVQNRCITSIGIRGRASSILEHKTATLESSR
jgi:hypothetical protein